MLERFLKEELADKYEVSWRYEFRTNSIIVDMRDGLLQENQIVGMDEIGGIGQAFFEFSMVQILRGMMRRIDEYRAKEAGRMKGETDDQT